MGKLDGTGNAGWKQSALGTARGRHFGSYERILLPGGAAEGPGIAGERISCIGNVAKYKLTGRYGTTRRCLQATHEMSETGTIGQRPTSRAIDAGGLAYAKRSLGQPNVRPLRGRLCRDSIEAGASE